MNHPDTWFDKTKHIGYHILCLIGGFSYLLFRTFVLLCAVFFYLTFFMLWKQVLEPEQTRHQQGHISSMVAFCFFIKFIFIPIRLFIQALIALFRPVLDYEPVMVYARPVFRLFMPPILNNYVGDIKSSFEPTSIKLWLGVITLVYFALRLILPMTGIIPSAPVPTPALSPALPSP